MQVMTADTAAYFAEACEAWRMIGEEDSLTEAEVRERFSGLERYDACHWALFGLTAEDEIAFEKDLAAAAHHLRALQIWGRALKDQLETLYAALERWADADRQSAKD